MTKQYLKGLTSGGSTGGGSGGTININFNQQQHEVDTKDPGTKYPKL